MSKHDAFRIVRLGTHNDGVDVIKSDAIHRKLHMNNK